MSTTMPTHVARDDTLADRNRWIKELAKTGQYTQVELAKRFRISQGRVSQIVRNPNADHCEPKQL